MNNSWEDENLILDEDREAEAKEEKMDTIMRTFNDQVQASSSSIDTAPESTTNQRRKKKGKRFRSAFTTTQINAMENEFKKHPYINHVRRQQLAEILKMSDKAIKVWFQNRRMKEKRDLDEEGSVSSEGQTDRNNTRREVLKYQLLRPKAKQKKQLNSEDISNLRNDHSNSHVSAEINIKNKRIPMQKRHPINHMLPFYQSSANKSFQDLPENLCIRNTDYIQKLTGITNTNQFPSNEFCQGAVNNNLRPLYPPIAPVQHMHWNRMNFVPIIPSTGVQMCPGLPLPTNSRIQPMKKCSCDCHSSASLFDINDVRIPSQPLLFIMPTAATNSNKI